jgi:hypothetical protein
MAEVIFHLMWEPGPNDLGFLFNAERFVENGTISQLPEVKWEQGHAGLIKVTLTMPECDRPFWLGFYIGIDYCRNNRGITVDA